MPSEQEKVTKPSDNVLTPEEKPSSFVGITIAIVVLLIGLFIASLYFGILNI